MSPENALNIWRSIRTTFVLFLVVVPLVILANLHGDDSAGPSWDELALPGWDWSWSQGFSLKSAGA